MKSIKLFNDPDLQAEYHKAAALFDLRRRETPKPWFPPKRELISETDILKRLSHGANDKALCLYLHIPFCETKCTFCDLYCFQTPPNRRQAMFKEYVDCLVAEINFWSRILDLSHNKITSIHFGGGSPLSLPKELMNRLLDALRDRFSISAVTEIAIEITVSQICDENIRYMADQGIRRIHVGVQTLDAHIRKLIGRRHDGKTTLKKLALIGADFVTSADMLYGLPGQTSSLFLENLAVLAEIHIDGFALYEMNLTPRLVRRLADSPDGSIDKLASYAMLLQGKRFLNQQGFQNAFFNHYGNRRDRNLYFTYPSRWEDCLAFGAIADGLINSIIFRHKKYRSYIEAVKNGGTGLELGYVENLQRSTVKHFETLLMSGCIPQFEIQTMIAAYGVAFEGLFGLWTCAWLLLKEKDNYYLTGSGCWLLSNMLEQVRRL